MVVRIDCLGDAEVKTALAERFQISIQAFILCHKQTDNFTSGIIYRTVEGIFNASAKPFVRSGINLYELAGMKFSSAAVCAVPDFFLFGAFNPSFFSILRRAE